MWTVTGKLHKLMMRMLCVVGLSAICLMLSFARVSAEDLSVEAIVNSNKVSLQDYVELTLTVKGAKGKVPAIAIPEIDGFDARFVGPATKFTVVNGVSSTEHSFIYDLFPSKVGHYQVPSLEVNLEGQTLKTKTIDIEVVDKPASSSGDSGDGTEQTIEDKVFMQAALGPKKVYVGQKTPLIMKVFVKDVSLQLASAPYVNPDGFTADPTADMEKSKETVNGVSFDSLTFSTNIYPTRPGSLKVGPFLAQGELIYRTKRNVRDEFFGDLFATTQSRPISLHAPVIDLEVLPLPIEGQPTNFSGAVGSFEFRASVGPNTVKVGDPLTLHMSISGQGRLKDLKFPSLSDPRFKTYDPQFKEAQGVKTVDQVIIPADKNITEVPALSFSYFDPQEKRYRTVTQGPFPIKVIAPSKGEEFKAYGFVDKTKTVTERPLIGLSGIKSLAIKVLHAGYSVVRNLWFWVFVLIAVVVWFVWAMWREFRKRLKEDHRFAREWKADAKARELLKQAKACLNEGHSKEFYRNTFKTLNDYFADKMHVPSAGLHWHAIEAFLNQRSADPTKVGKMRELFERCDLARFASMDVSKDQMAKDFETLQELFDYLRKICK